MIRTLLIALSFMLAGTAQAADRSIPRQLDEAQATAYRAVFADIRDGKWADARLRLDAMPVGPLHAIARARIVTAKGSPRAEGAELVQIVTAAPELPQAEQLVRMAKTRGAVDLPPLPQAQPLVWVAGAPVRSRAKATKSDAAAAELAIKMVPLVKDDRGEEAEALLATYAPSLTPEALTEWQQKVAFIYYVAGNDASARSLAAQASRGVGDWAVHAAWTGALAAWRQKDCNAAGAGFSDVAARSSDVELRAAGLYWAARADLMCGRPQVIEARLKNASQHDETFYGLLARQALGIRERKGSIEAAGAAAWQQLAQRPNARVAAALVEIGEDALADEVVRHQARIGSPVEFAALTRLAGDLDLPATQVWLSNNCPPGAQPAKSARYPAPGWTPDGGWRVDRSLVYAHALQESRFRTAVVSPAGAYGLMQIMPAAATDFARARGLGAVDRSALTRPQLNMEVGQSHLERLRDNPGTGGLLPKVIAAYNAGPMPVGLWNTEARDGGDPLLYIESIPYWETRGYVAIVLRNYWMYEANAGKPSVSRAALAQGLWPRFPGLSGPNAVRIVTQPAPPRLRPLPPPLPAIASASADQVAGGR